MDDDEKKKSGERIHTEEDKVVPDSNDPIHNPTIDDAVDNSAVNSNEGEQKNEAELAQKNENEVLTQAAPPARPTSRSVKKNNLQKRLKNFFAGGFKPTLIRLQRNLVSKLPEKDAVRNKVEMIFQSALKGGKAFGTLALATAKVSAEAAVEMYKKEIKELVEGRTEPEEESEALDQLDAVDLLAMEHDEEDRVKNADADVKSKKAAAKAERDKRNAARLALLNAHWVSFSGSIKARVQLPPAAQAKVDKALNRVLAVWNIYYKRWLVIRAFVVLWYSILRNRVVVVHSKIVNSKEYIMLKKCIIFIFGATRRVYRGYQRLKREFLRHFTLFIGPYKRAALHWVNANVLVGEQTSIKAAFEVEPSHLTRLIIRDADHSREVVITDRSVAAPLLEAVWTLAFHSVAQRTKLIHKFELFFSFEDPIWLTRADIAFKVNSVWLGPLGATEESAEDNRFFYRSDETIPCRFYKTVLGLWDPDLFEKEEARVSMPARILRKILICYPRQNTGNRKNGELRSPKTSSSKSVSRKTVSNKVYVAEAQKPS